jgi:hypothetical protein
MEGVSAKKIACKNFGEMNKIEQTDARNDRLNRLFILGAGGIIKKNRVNYSRK